jgi:N-acetyl sugar amidotransferase
MGLDEEGICNACRWHEKKQDVIDWDKKWQELEELCDSFRKSGDQFDCIAPCSGGKDGTYVAWKLKHELNMNPLCITFMPQLQTPLGKRNLENFKASGFDHITISPDPQAYREYAREAFIEMGMPKQSFVVGISSAITRYADKFDIPLIFYGEQGEVEYGGEEDTQNLKKIDQDFLKNIYYEGEDPSKWGYWWKLPSEKQLDRLHLTWWSLFEDWDPEPHAKLAKEKCGMEMLVGGSIGTFTNYSQLDDIMQDLHAYLMFIKFGFGRCTSDASIEIRRGRLSRAEGIKLVNKLDGQFPVEYEDAYLDYFEMTKEEFWAVIDSFVDYGILKKTDKPERPYELRESCV